MAVDDLLRFAHRPAGYRDVKTMIEQVPNVCAHHQSGSEYNDFFHVKVLSRRPLAAASHPM
jgi:hypothetical protein